MAYTKVVVQTADFDAGKESAALLAGDTADGALVTFTGLVRGGGITAMELEHYPEMTEKSLRAIVDDARRRWPVLGGVTIIHRVGKLLPGDQIVLVIVASPHRAAAFEAAEFMMNRPVGRCAGDGRKSEGQMEPCGPRVTAVFSPFFWR